jgi:hypothetical protein
MIEPTAHNVSQVIVEEMMKWKTTADVEQRRSDLTALSERLIRYFSIFYSSVAPHNPKQHPGAIVPGLPGGLPLA